MYVCKCVCIYGMASCLCGINLNLFLISLTLLLASMSAPLSRSTAHIAVRPYRAALCNAVSPRY